ncbi:MAG: methyltransferase domain-containing protein [Anaerolineae bacterium]|nr:methyltransferase domain-containing protein [Anaerolineae bacterium]
MCPKCKRPLRSIENALQCDECNQTYPIVGGIPNFIAEGLLANVAPNYRDIKRLEFLAPVYEGRLWHSFILRMAGAGASSLQSIEHFIAETLEGVTGVVLDVACGPATYGRWMASPERSVYGIDFSMGTLQQGMKNIARDGVSNIRLARTRVEELPFEDAVFDGAICGGSLHLFPDTALALREIARTLKPSAPLAVTTFVAGNWLLARMMKRRKNMHAFELPGLQQYLAEAGFEGFESKLDGTFLMFRTRKAALCTGAV